MFVFSREEANWVDKITQQNVLFKRAKQESIKAKPNKELNLPIRIFFDRLFLLWCCYM